MTCIERDDDTLDDSTIVQVAAIYRAVDELSRRVQERTSQLAAGRKMYKNLFEEVPCYLTVVDREFVIVRANKRFEDQFGSKVGQKCYIGYKERHSKCDNCPVEKTFSDGLSHESEEIWRRDGRDSNIMVRTAPLFDESGSIVAVMEMSSDVTEVKRLQSELAALGETVAGLSHTIKNILAGLQGGVYVVDSGLSRGKEDRVEQGWAMVKRNVEKVSELVHGILYASKEREPEYRESDPAKLLWEVCELYDRAAASAGVVLIRDFDLKQVMGVFDPAGIHSAVSNLVSNAIDACTRADRNPRTVTVQGRVEGDTFAIVVSDNGTGMPDEVREKLFGKFYSTKGGGGTGLGLVITKKIVQEHGGTITVDTRAGEGTTFRIDIPMRPAQWPEGREAVL